MNADDIKSEAVEVLGRYLANVEGDPWDVRGFEERIRYREQIEPMVDALAAAGLLPTGPVVGWAVAECPSGANLPPNIDDVFAPGERAAADEWRAQADEYFDGRHPHCVYELREATGE